MKTETFPVGDEVQCDFCGEFWTDRTESGGFLFQSKAVCPDCAKRTIDKIRSYGEERFIREHCPPDLSFADWVRKLRYRTGDDHVIIRTEF